MKPLSRRKFLNNSVAASLALGTGLSGCEQTKMSSNAVQKRNHFLEGLTKQDIKITDVKVTLLSCEVPPEEQWYLDWIPERYKCWKTDSILVEVFTDVGIKGIGGCTQYGGPARVKEYVENQIKPAILGKNPFDIEFLTPGVYRRGPMVGWAGVDSALWDIIGKAVDKPVYELLAIDHKPQKKVPVYASAGEMYDGDIWPDNLVAEALEMKGKGFKAYKFRPGTHWSVSGMTMDKYIEGVWKIRKAVGPDFGLIQECNAQWNMEQVMQFIPEAEKMKLLWIEDPIRRSGKDVVQNYRKIREALTNIKLSFGGDTMDNRFMYKEWIDNKAMDVVQPDAGVMGITETWYVSRMANLQEQVCAPHCWHGSLLAIANAHVAAGIPNLLMLEVAQTYNPLRTDLFKTPIKMEDGYMILPDGPGLGVEVIDNPDEKFPFMPGTYDKPRPV